MTEPSPHRPALRLTRRGRLARTVLVLLLAVVLVLIGISLVRGGSAARTGGGDGTQAAGTIASDEGGADPAATDDAAADDPATPEAESADADDEQLVRSGTVGAGTWTLAAPIDTEAPTVGVLRSYAVRVEDGIDVDADEAAQEIAAVLADERGWQDPAEVVFHQIADPSEAEFTITIASPPTVDELCLPADTGGLWSCRIGSEVALNADRWLHATPTYDDLAEYRAYMINHEVGHFLGHDHTRCPAEGASAPVMLQQSIDLQGCVPNAWPGTES